MIKLDKKLSNAGARYLDSLTILNYLSFIAAIVSPVILVLVTLYLLNCVKVLLP